MGEGTGESSFQHPAIDIALPGFVEPSYASRGDDGLY